MANEKIVHIKWEYFPNPSKISSTEGGVYQFYGWHPVYSKDGEEVLLYIGITNNFKRRMDEHIQSWEWIPKFLRPESIKIRLGRISSNEAAVSLKSIESLLIFMHSPAWNSSEIAEYSRDEEDVIVIINEGERGQLLERVNDNRGKDGMMMLGK